MAEKTAKSMRLSNRTEVSSVNIVTILGKCVEHYAIVVTDDRRRIISWGSGSESFFGYTSREIVGESIDILFPPLDRISNVPELQFEKALRRGKYEFETFMMRKNTSSFWISGAITALREADGVVRGSIYLIRDMTIANK